MIKRREAKCGFCKSKIEIVVRGSRKEAFCEKCQRDLTESNIIDPSKEGRNPHLGDSQLGGTIKMMKK
jgi:hypothetical protein